MELRDRFTHHGVIRILPTLHLSQVRLGRWGGGGTVETYTEIPIW